MKITGFSGATAFRAHPAAASRFRFAAAGGLLAITMLVMAILAGCSTPIDTEAQSNPQSTASLSGSAGNASAELMAAPAADAGSAPVGRSVPVRIAIPAIEVDSDLIGLGLRSDGTMEVPSGGFPGGWYTGSPTPGELGPSIIAGHVDMNGSPGIFFRLRELTAGDTITVTRADDTVTTFRVSDNAQYPKSEFPTQSVYGDIGFAGLRLITCGGTFDDSAASYDDNIVVYAELESAR
jgi:sortase (surface protein transpeptidase)